MQSYKAGFNAPRGPDTASCLPAGRLLLAPAP